jgi:indolepyruvate ferredoxin oxidoreductase alpha subunit
MKKLMLGNEAVARGAYEAGVTVATAYPGTPSTEITECIAKYDEIYSEWSPNEKVALEVAVGAAIAGARAICSMKHVGLNVAADPLFTASYTGVNGGLIIMVADDPGMHSSQNEQDSRYYARASKVPLLEPADSLECKDFIKKAFQISEDFDTPVIVRLTTRIAHSQSIVDLEARKELPLKEYCKNPAKNVMMPAMARKRHLEVEKRMASLADFAENTELNQIQWGSKEIGVIASGIAYQYAKEALGDVSYLKLGLVHPLPERLIRQFAKEVKTLYVIEELEPFIEDQVKKMGLPVVGKELLPVTGELTAQLIKEKILGIKNDYKPLFEEPIPVRPPVMCPGCPHRGMFYVLKKLGLTVSGDIGCYTLGALPPVDSIDTCICMGASIGAAHGMEKARGREFGAKTVAIIGDSTFIHSGITGLIDVVYNKGNSTVIILDNSITGMTGHQHNPASGFTIKGEPTKQVDLVNLAKAVGVNRVRVADPFAIDEFEKIVREETAAEEPSVIISQRPCALLKQVKYQGPLIIDQERCKKCKLCLKIACPAIIDGGDSVRINADLCVGCELCARLCKFDAIKKAGGQNND